MGAFALGHIGRSFWWLKTVDTFRPSCPPSPVLTLPQDGLGRGLCPFQLGPAEAWHCIWMGWMFLEGVSFLEVKATTPYPINVVTISQGKCSFTQYGVGLPPCLKRQQIFKFWHVRSLVSTIFDPNVVADELTCKGSSSDMILIFVILCRV